MQIQQCFGPFTMLVVERSSETGLFGHLSNLVFRSQYFRKHISYKGHLFFKNVQDFIYISKTQKKLMKRFLFLR